MPSYLDQTDNNKKSEVIKRALSIYWELIKQKNPKEKAKQIVLQRMGVVL